MRVHVSALIMVAALAGGAVAASAQPAETGTISGHVSLSSGGFIPPGSVQAVFVPSGIGGPVAHISAGSGAYEMPDLQPGEYKLVFSVDGKTQWAHQKPTSDEADVITVVAGQVTVVDETMLPGGVIAISVTDSVTGHPVDNVCGKLVFGGGPPVCGAQNGVLRLTDLPRGDHTVEVSSSDGLHARTRLDDIHVELGQTVEVAAALRPTAAITTTVLDAGTNEPAFHACVLVLEPRFGALERERCHYTDGSGQVLIGELPAARYNLFVVPQSTERGAQWVGPAGGTGDQLEALVVRTRIGRSTEVGPVRLDPAGTIAGVVRDAATGEPVRDGNFCASLLPGDLTGICTDTEGRYELTGVGPYRWPVLFSGPFYSTYGWQWSGGWADRYSAQRVAVTAGQTTTLEDVNLVPAGQITGRTLNPDGSEFTGSGEVRSFNARTGDQAGPHGSAFFGSYTVTGFASQRIKLQLLVSGRITWYDQASTFAEATPVRVRSGRTTTGIDLVVPVP